MRWLPITLPALALLWAPDAEATYSIAAVDTVTGEVGGAGTSCVGNFSVSVIYGAVPGAGVVHAQAFFNQAARDRAVQLLGQGEEPDAIIAAITSPQFDSRAARRQYGIATVDGARAAFTGAECGAWAGHTTGTVDRFAYTAQGNILTSENVVLSAAAAFEGGGCDLAERLMLALEAGANGGEGDSRCTPDGIPSDGAFIRVDRSNDPGWLDLRVDNTAPANPLVLLRAEFDQWRASHGCTELPPPADAGVNDTGAPESGTPDSGTPETGTADAASPPDASADAGATADASEAEPQKMGGCACAGVPNITSVLPLLLGLPLIRRRASRRGAPRTAARA